MYLQIDSADFITVSLTFYQGPKIFILFITEHSSSSCDAGDSEINTVDVTGYR
jgi:hypothetical protein